MSAPTEKTELQTYLAFAKEVAVEAGKITLKYFQGTFDVEAKADSSPVTIADRETEKFIRARILAHYPGHGILGEEFGVENAESRFQWIIDPIDGTKSFVRGVPLYTVLVALLIDDEPLVGVIHNPPLGETIAAATGLGCTYNDEPCHVSQTAELSQAWLQCTDYTHLMQTNPKFCTALIGSVGASRTWADAYGYLSVVTGRADVMIDAEMSLWDMACLKPIVEEAGGRFTDLEGKASIRGKNSVATNGLLHDEVLRMVALDRA